MDSTSRIQEYLNRKEMSKVSNIFIKANSSFTDLKQEIELVLDINFLSGKEEEELYYTSEYTTIILEVNRYVTDTDLNFSDFPYVIEISVGGLYSPYTRESLLREVSIYIYNKLKQTNKYMLLYVLNFQILIERYIPPNSMLSS